MNNHNICPIVHTQPHMMDDSVSKENKEYKYLYQTYFNKIAIAKITNDKAT